MSTPTAGKRRPYVRPMEGWWRKNSFFVEYMIHEGTAFFVAAYAAVLLYSLIQLGQGEAAWNAWVLCLKSPMAIVFHIACLVALAYHTWTWFHIMPRTLPPIFAGGKRVSGPTITHTGLAAAVGASIILLLVAKGVLS